MIIHQITDQHSDFVKYYKNLHYTPRIHQEEDLLIAEGSKCTKKLLESDLDVVSIMCCEKYFDILLHNFQNKLSNVDILLVSKDIMNDIVGFRLHEHIISIGNKPPYSTIDKQPSKICVLNGIVNSENVGAIIRNAAAFGIKSVIFDNKTSSPYLRRAIRVSMGAVFFTEVCKSTHIIEDLTKLQQSGYKIISVEQNNEAISINNYNSTSKEVFVFGTESKGIDKEILTISDLIVEIPIDSAVDSLNVAACSAIVFNKCRGLM